MKLEDRVCSLKLATKLKELEVKQESLWYWYWWYTGSNNEYVEWGIVSKDFFDERMSKKVFERRYSAFTVAECLEIYKEEIIIPKGLTNIADFIAQKIIDKVEDL